MRRSLHTSVFCLAVVTGCTISPTVTSDVEASLINALTNTLAPSVNTAIATAVTNSQTVINGLAFALPWAKTAVDDLGPKYGVSTATIIKIDAAITIAETDLANPPTSVGAAVAEAVNTFNEAKTALGL